MKRRQIATVHKLSYLGERSEPSENARASGEAAGPAQSRVPPQSRLLSRASRACTFHDIPQIESLLAGFPLFKLSPCP